jgi:hypothetical protein
MTEQTELFPETLIVRDPGTPWPNPTGPWSPNPEAEEAARIVRRLAHDGIVRIVTA